MKPATREEIRAIIVEETALADNLAFDELMCAHGAFHTPEACAAFSTPPRVGGGLRLELGDAPVRTLEFLDDERESVLGVRKSDREQTLRVGVPAHAAEDLYGGTGAVDRTADAASLELGVVEVAHVDSPSVADEVLDTPGSAGSTVGEAGDTASTPSAVSPSTNFPEAAAS